MTSTIPTSTASATTATAAPSCTTAVPGKYGYVPPSACNANYAFSPSLSAAIAFSVLFAIVSVVQVAQAFLYKKRFCWVIIMACLWELGSFVTRALGSHNQQSSALALVNQLLLLLAPLWINAYVYMTAGRLIWTFLPDKQIWKIKAMSIGKYFVWLDIFSFVVQGLGGTMLQPSASANQQKLGKNIYMTGVGVQELFIVLFTVLIVRFQIEMMRLEKSAMIARTRKWLWMTYALYVTLALITVSWLSRDARGLRLISLHWMRIVFRLVEFSAGIEESNPLPYHEAYALALDASPMLLAITILSVLHPGMVLQGPESDFPSRKVKKQMKKERKEAKKAIKSSKPGAGFEYGQGTEYSPLGNRGSTNLINDVELQVPHENRFVRDGTSSGNSSRDHSKDRSGDEPRYYPAHSI